MEADLAELAELASELREMRPAPSQRFAAELDSAAAEGFGGGGRSGRFAGLAARLGAVPPRRMLLTAGAGALTAVVIATAVVEIGDSGGSRRGALPGSNVDTAGAPAGAATGSSKAERPRGSALLDRAGPAATANSAAAAPAEQIAPSGPFASKRSRRAVERSAQLVLGTDPDGVRPAADRVFATVGRYDGIVLSSTISDGDSGEPSADFSLLIPSDRLSAALTDLSAIAEVRSRQESAEDITAPTVTVGERLRDARAEIEGLLKQLANADTDAERASVEGAAPLPASAGRRPARLAQRSAAPRQLLARLRPGDHRRRLGPPRLGRRIAGRSATPSATPAASSRSRPG